MITRRATFALITGTFMAPWTLACSNNSGRGSLQSQVHRAHRKASAVVLARVVAAGFQGAFASPFGESPTYHAKLEVMEAWKGKHRRGSLLQTFAPTTPGTCAPVLAPGETYLLYLRNREPYNVSLSHRSAALEGATEEIAILRDRFGKDP